MFHVCESGKRQSSFICPRGTIFNQKHRVCDWWYNVKCEDSTEFYDLNLDLLLLEKSKASSNAQTKLNVPPPIDPLAGLLGSGGLDDGLLESLTTNDASDILGQVKLQQLRNKNVVTKNLFCLSKKSLNYFYLFLASR